jgi:IS1 family transposase
MKDRLINLSTRSDQGQARRLQADEIWSFVGAKQKNVPAEKAGKWGDLWTWTGIDADSKLIVSYMVGPRTPPMAYEFMKDMASRVVRYTQITTDGLYWYVDAVDNAFGIDVDNAFGIDVDYAQLHKHYGSTGDTSSSGRYSPAKYTGSSKEIIRGEPNPRHISTSFIERNNLTMRMSMRRFTRLTNGFSKKAQNHAHAVALHFMYYNFARVHQTLRVTPAMEAGLTQHVWSIAEIVGLLADEDRKAA